MFKVKPLVNYRYIFSVLWLCISTPAFAFDGLPEFHSLNEAEADLLERPSDLGPEYTSDLVAYRKPSVWNSYYLQNPLVFDGSVGSVSAKHFLIDHRVKLYKPFSEAIELRAHYLQDRNRELDQTHLVLELVFRPFAQFRQFGFSIYGEPSLYKREDDTGLALFWNPSPTSELRLFNTFVDVTRLRRNDRADTYIEPHLPYSRGLSFKLWRNISDTPPFSSEFIDFTLRQDTRTQWSFPQTARMYEYWKLTSTLHTRFALAMNRFFNSRFQMDRTWESNQPTSAASSVVAQHQLRDRFLMAHEAESHSFYKRVDVRHGIDFSYRTWKTESGTAVEADTIPYLWVEPPGFGEDSTEGRWKLGYQAVFHRVTGPTSLFMPEEKVGKTTVDHRLNVGYAFNFGPSAELFLLITGDIDKFGTKETWSGGNGQLRVVF